MRLEKSIYTHSSSSSVKDLLLFSKKGESKGIFCFGPNVLLMVIPCHNDRFHLEHKSPSKQRIPSWRINATRERVKTQNLKTSRVKRSASAEFKMCNIFSLLPNLLWENPIVLPIFTENSSCGCQSFPCLFRTIIFKNPDFDLLILPFKLQF